MVALVGSLIRIKFGLDLLSARVSRIENSSILPQLHIESLSVFINTLDVANNGLVVVAQVVYELIAIPKLFVHTLHALVDGLRLGVLLPAFRSEVVSSLSVSVNRLGFEMRLSGLATEYSVIKETLGLAGSATSPNPTQNVVHNGLPVLTHVRRRPGLSVTHLERLGGERHRSVSRSEPELLRDLGEFRFDSLLARFRATHRLRPLVVDIVVLLDRLPDLVHHMLNLIRVPMSLHQESPLANQFLKLLAQQEEEGVVLRACAGIIYGRVNVVALQVMHEGVHRTRFAQEVGGVFGQRTVLRARVKERQQLLAGQDVHGPLFWLHDRLHGRRAR